MITSRAFARFGLIGNPSDGYFGKTISGILRNFHSQVVIYETPRLQILPRQSDRLEYDSINGLVEDVQRKGYYGGIRLLKAAIKRFADHFNDRGIVLPEKNFTIEYETGIPVRVGLAGSSGIITATMRALSRFYDVEIDKPLLPSLILSVELDELGIGAGLQDRVIQVYEGMVYMDFERDYLESTGHGHYENLDPDDVPNLFIAYHSDLAEGTEVVHNDLRSRFNRGDRAVIAGMERFASFAESARSMIKSGKGDQIGPLMDENFDLRDKLTTVNPGHKKLVTIGRKEGAHVKFAGSGGAVVGQYSGDPEQLTRIKVAYANIGARLVLPQFDEPE